MRKLILAALLFILILRTEAQIVSRTSTVGSMNQPIQPLNSLK